MSKKIINLSKHSFTDNFDRNDKKSRRFSNINTQAVIYTNEQLQQLYTGLYLDENLHNVGTYRWLSDSDIHKYEGKLFLNNLHGYGKLEYPDGTLYEGLFYFNKRFGPGVVTYPERQDVGLWDGKYLIRLSEKFSVSDFYKEHIPKLSDSMQSKLYLLQFKHLIPISEKYTDSAKDILIKLGATDKVLANKKVLYSKLIRNPKSKFINGEKLYKNFFTYEDELRTTINVLDHFDNDGEPVIVELEVCNLVAWNNEAVNTVILKHAFLNRHYEKLLSFKVNDILCAKSRGNFLPPGPIETKSQELLFACRSANPTPVRRLITENDLYPDVADCRGNNTVTYATLANQTKIIKVLAEFGANLNSLNDDCITPLMFAILDYIALKYEITGTLWESAFIYAKAENILPACNQQWPTVSTTTISDNSEACQLSQTSKFSGSQTSIPQNNKHIPKFSERRDTLISLFTNYLFSLDCLHPKQVITNIRKTINLEMMPRKSIAILESELKKQHFDIESTKICKTISTLLLCGADPNVGEVPFCPIITSIFTRCKDIIQTLISFNVNVNAKTCEYLGRLGPLHVIGSLSPCIEQLEMAFVFLENGTRVDDFTNKIHWLEEQNILLADKAPEDGLEKTPLHLVCMRYDFKDDKDDYLIELALMFIQYGANLHIQYLGHTPLTLAMMRGNTKLMETLLKTGLVDPNEGLGYNMGVPLTLCILKRYSKLLQSFEKQFCAILMQFNANPLNDVPNFNGNVIEFYYCEQSTEQTKKTSSSLLLQYAKATLLKFIQSKVVQILFQFKIIFHLHSPLFNVIVQYLNYQRTIDILQILIDHDKIVTNNYYIKKLLSFVNKKESNQKVNIVKSKGNYKIFHFQNFMPEIDPDVLKYKVCFQCFRKTDQTLLLCPKCEMVYFCSQNCNVISVKTPNSGHPCKELFYASELINMQSGKRRSTQFKKMKKSMLLNDSFSSADEDMEGRKSKRKKKGGRDGSDDGINESSSEGSDEERKSRNKKSGKKSRKGSKEETENGSIDSKTGKAKKKKSSNLSDDDSENDLKSRKAGARGRKKYGDFDEDEGSSSSRRKPTGSTDFDENMFNKINKTSAPTKPNLRMLLSCKMPVIDMDKRNMYLKLRAQMIEKDKEINVRRNVRVQSKFTEKIKLDKNCTKLMLELARKNIPNLPTDFEELNVKFWQMYSPYCVFQNGQLYYNFNENNNDVYYKVTYSNI